ncbi:MAG: hypothetical protein LUC88_02005, partial [Prevotella sp.]|nr:hypothetical protein [Prevotella sp.]
YNNAAERAKFKLSADVEGMKYEQPTRKECIENLKRLTHERGLMEFVVRRYAMLRGWNVDETVSAVMQQLQRFEEHNSRRKRVKRAFK